jgi:signal transduction histidine kinase
MRLPRFYLNSLFARVALILLVNLVLVQAVGFGLINLEVEAFDLGVRRLPERIAGAIKQIDSAPADECFAAGRQQTTEMITYVVRQGEMPSDVGAPARPSPRDIRPGRPTLNEMSLYLKLHLAEYLPSDQTVVVLRGPVHGDDASPPRAFDGPPGPSGPSDDFHGFHGPRSPDGYGHVGVQLTNGCWAEIMLHGPPPDFAWIRLLTRFGGFGLVIVLCSLWFARGAARSLGQFSAAADAVGRSVDAPLLPESGPREVRLAAKAFNRMQERLKRFVNDRTQMLAAISHDLRTPLTRLRLRAEFVDDDAQRGKMLGDIAEMEAMIAATLAFARDDAVREPRSPQDLDQLLDQLASDLCDGGYPVQYEPTAPVVVSCSPGSLRRALANLAENAVKYGGVARLMLERAGDLVTILIEDDGPGIASEMAEQVFQPFFRLEGSRNRDTGGVGLGLSVARTIIRGHGGDVALSNRPEGGLRVTVTLPA